MRGGGGCPGADETAHVLINNERSTLLAGDDRWTQKRASPISKEGGRTLIPERKRAALLERKGKPPIRLTFSALPPALAKLTTERGRAKGRREASRGRSEGLGRLFPGIFAQLSEDH